MHEQLVDSEQLQITARDPLRLSKLYDYEILDTRHEDTFDKIALLASQVFETPNAFITFIDKDRVFFKSNISDYAADKTPIDNNLFAISIVKDDFTVYDDTYTDPFLRDSPLVRVAGGIRFYAAAPLRSPEGYLVGTVCVADSIPRDNFITGKQVDMLKSLADIIINKLESRLRFKNLLKLQDELTNITIHEIKNPLATIRLANDVLMKNPQKLERMAPMIKQGVARIESKLHEVLRHSEMQEENMTLFIEDIDLSAVFASVIKDYELQAERKSQTIRLDISHPLPQLQIDKKKICDVFHNLLSNAIKYSHNNTTITIVAVHDGENIQVEFRDEGQGLDSDDMQRLFMKFATLSALPTGKETSTGLGLYICKSIIDLHNGKIYAVSKGKTHGTSFYVLLPLVYTRHSEPEL